MKRKIKKKENGRKRKTGRMKETKKKNIHNKTGQGRAKIKI